MAPPSVHPEDEAVVWERVVALLELSVSDAMKRTGPIAFLSEFAWSCYTNLLDESPECWTSPIPGQTYPTTSVMGVPSAVKPFSTATRTWNSAT